MSFFKISLGMYSTNGKRRVNCQSCLFLETGFQGSQVCPLSLSTSFCNKLVQEQCRQPGAQVFRDSTVRTHLTAPNCGTLGGLNNTRDFNITSVNMMSLSSRTH